MIPSHHPSESLLVSYGAGGVDEAVSLAVSTHLAFCPACRVKVNDAETVGGILLDSLPPAPPDGSMRVGILERLAREPHDPPATPPKPLRPSEGSHDFPRPLQELVGGSADKLSWKPLVPGVAQVPLVLNGRSKGRLLRIVPGKRIPEHSHGAMELTLVLRGAFTDSRDRFARGDLAEADDSVVHSLIADPELGCICLAVTEAPLRLTSRLGRLLGPFF